MIVLLKLHALKTQKNLSSRCDLNPHPPCDLVGCSVTTELHVVVSKGEIMVFD